MKRITNGIIQHRWILCVLLLSVFLRMFKLGEVPISLDWDEAALGYNAYSVLKTGRDEYGTKFPLVLRSFDDYKPPLYMYLTIPSVALFGLTPWSVRLPSVVMGLFAILGTYFLVMELIALWPSSKYKYIQDRFLRTYLPSISAFLLAISPWHLQFSRIAFEANTGVTLNIWVVVFFLKSLKKIQNIYISALLSGIAMYAYHSERIFLPLLLLLVVLVFYKTLFKHPKTIIFACIIGVVIIAPLVWVMRDPTTWMRLRGTSSLSDEVKLLERSVIKLRDDTASGNVFGQLFDNRRIVWAHTIYDGYISHFSFRWLFLTGDNDRHHAPDMGLLYIWELPFLLWGIFEVYRRGGTFRTILFGWFFISPLPASVTSEVPHAIRSMVFLPTFQLFTAIGLLQCIYAMRTKIYENKDNFKRYIWMVNVCIFVGIIVFNFAYYLSMYYIHMNHEFSRFWQYGYKEAVNYVKKNKEKYTRVVVSPKLEQPHMFFLFFTAYDPKKYLEQGGTRSGGFAENMNRFDVFEFRPIHYDSEIHDGKTLYIGTPLDIPGTPQHLIRYLDSSEAIKIAE